MTQQLLKHKKLLKFVKNSDDKFVVFGLSDTTKQMIKKYNFLKKSISYIVDNNYKNLAKSFSNIPIKNPATLTHENVIIWGHHTNSIIKDLKNTKCNCFIDYNFSKTNLLDKRFNFTLEFPAKTANINDTNQQFARLICKKLLEFYRPIYIEQIVFSTQYHKKYRDIKDKNHLIISYHSIGNANKQILRWKEGYLKDMITFDKKGYSGWSSLCDKDIDKLLKNISQKKADKFFDKLANKYINNNQSKYIQPEQQNFTFPKEDFIFFPLQTINDSVMEHSYHKPLKLIKRVIKIVSSQEIPLVIKQHPRCHDEDLKILLQRYEKEGKIILFNGSIHEAISKATTVYTINSGVGFESLLHLKPVVTFGRSDYMSMTKNVKNLDKIIQNPFYKLSSKKRDKIKKFIYYYIKNKCLFLENKRNLEKLIYKIIEKSIR